jgi:polysaccharide chain length determinant protein (PEP-CTERM system associated)
MNPRTLGPHSSWRLKMPETEKPFDIHAYIEIALRRKWYIIIPLVCSILVSFGVYKYLPKVYRATTLILVQPQRVPESYVRPTITDPMTSRLNTIGQEILSRTRLEKVIQEFNLYSELHSKPMEEIIEIMRKAIEVKVQENPRTERTQNSFTISFEGKEPRTVMMVTNKLASLFIEENLRVRETQAESTAEFLSKELLHMEDQLKRKEQQIQSFKERNIGQLPQQQDANLRILDRLQQQLQTTNQNLRAAEDRAVLYQNQIGYLKNAGPQRNLVPGPENLVREQLPEDPLITQLNNLKRDLSIAQSKYTESHPDVIDLKKKIANLEPKVQAKIKAAQEVSAEDNVPAFVLDPATKKLLTQYTEQMNEAQLEARRYKDEVRDVKEQIAQYEKRVEETPKREQELLLLTRDYDLLKSNYQSLLDKKIQAQMAENLERKQQGEQFKILDPARLPEKPVKPDRNRILLMGAIFGIMASLGLTWFRESMDQSFHSVSDVEVYLAIPVIATIPNLKEEQHVSEKRRAISPRR